jgi:hypothetical protein
MTISPHDTYLGICRVYHPLGVEAINMFRWVPPEACRANQIAHVLDNQQIDFIRSSGEARWRSMTASR